jgi:hypothetical protein
MPVRRSKKETKKPVQRSKKETKMQVLMTITETIVTPAIYNAEELEAIAG